MAAPAPTVDEWTDRLAPLFPESLHAVREAITSTPAIQQWLNKASFEAAEGLAQVPPMQAEMEGYGRMMDGLEDHFPELLTAVERLTEGHGRIDLHWRPLAPNFTYLFVNFGRSYSVDLYCALPDASIEGAGKVLATVRAALPSSTPFPGRPHTATAVTSHGERSAGVRLAQHRNASGDSWLTVTLLPDTGEPVEDLKPGVAPARLLACLQAD
ncbi:hypothetical protein [Salisaeta longa]|uniref:hypothetical protein n=1 Tax=Salisaeta longa TaxID=503170 RepID=UPI0003B326CA|nr:hypothetical protein [Salisaeta longa]